MPNNQPRNKAIVFDLYSDPKLGPVPVLLSKIGKILFTIFFVCEILIYYLQESINQGKVEPLYLELLTWATGIGFFGGFLLLSIVGIYYVGIQKNMPTFLPAFRYVIARVGLYLFLPAVVITVLMITLAWMFKDN